MSICLSVYLCVRPLLWYRLTIFLPPLPEVGCPIFLEIRNPWGKVMERTSLTFEHFCLEMVLNRRAKKKVFFLLILPYKTWWKPRFPMDQRPLVKGYIVNIGISLDVSAFWMIFSLYQTIWFQGILGPPYCGISATIRIGQNMLCLPYAGFLLEVLFWPRII